ncbi:high-affinity Zn(2+) transporter zrt1 [Fusarium falciforme]
MDLDHIRATYEANVFGPLILATGLALITPIGMAIGIGVLNVYNSKDPSRLIAIGTLDAPSAGILPWVGLVETWAHDWMSGGELTMRLLIEMSLEEAHLVSRLISIDAVLQRGKQSHVGAFYLDRFSKS